MNTVHNYLFRLKKSIFHKGEEFALDGGITFGPGSDPKGSFYSSPKLSIYWYQPESPAVIDEPVKAKGLISSMILKLGSLRMSA